MTYVKMVKRINFILCILAQYKKLQKKREKKNPLSLEWELSNKIMLQTVLLSLSISKFCVVLILDSRAISLHMSYHNSPGPEMAKLWSTRCHLPRLCGPGLCSQQTLLFILGTLSRPSTHLMDPLHSGLSILSQLIKFEMRNETYLPL